MEPIQVAKDKTVYEITERSEKNVESFILMGVDAYNRTHKEQLDPEIVFELVRTLKENDDLDYRRTRLIPK